MRRINRASFHKQNKINKSTFSLALFLMIACFGIVGCGEASSNNLPGRSDSTDLIGSAQTRATTDTGRLGGTWFLVAVLPSDTAAGKIPTINFDETAKTFSGNTGCNSMRGNFSLTDSTLKINEQIITTKMACPGYNEDAFLKSLPKANGYRFENGMLVLLSDQTELSKWTRQPVKPTTKTT